MNVLLTDDFANRRDSNSSEKELCENYKNIIEKNIKKNDEKAEQIADGIKNSVIGFIRLRPATTSNYGLNFKIRYGLYKIYG
ncbi:hypothetical protein QYZ88_016205 [Lachnospiraceae bacterium C1.1]|nr:hypothetical protein [Lachnospiraceae bacterium C1.1]